MTPIEILIGIVASGVSIAAVFSKPRHQAGPIFLVDGLDADDPIAVPPAVATPDPPRVSMLCAMPQCGATTHNRISLIAADGRNALEISLCPACFALAASRGNAEVVQTLRSWGTRVAVVQHEDTGVTL